MSVILTIAYLFQKLFVTSKVSENVAFLENKSVSIILRSILNEGFEQINKKNVVLSNDLLKLTSLRTFHQIAGFKRKLLYVIFTFSNSENMTKQISFSGGTFNMLPSV